MKNRAFKMFIYEQPFDVSALHMAQLLLHGPANNVAWELMEEYHGEDWSCPPEQIKDYVAAVIFKAKREITNNIKGE